MIETALPVTAERAADLVADVPAIVWITGAIALLAVLFPLPWRISRTVVTIVHEAGHALTGFVAGRRLRGIRLHSDTSGVTVSHGRRSGPGMVFTTLAGYPAPALLGLLFAGMIRVGWHSAVLVVAAVLLLGVLVLVRNVYGVFTVLLAAAVLAAVAALASAEVRTGFVYVICWFLLLAAVRPVFELASKRRRRGAPDSDVDQLARLTRMPAGLWLVLLGVLTLCCLLGGGALLVSPVLR